MNLFKPKYKILQLGKYYVVKKTKFFIFTNYLDSDTVKYQNWGKSDLQFCYFTSEEAAKKAIELDQQWESL